MTAPVFLTFSIALDRFAIPAADVVEVLRAVAVTPLPGAPPVVIGAIDYRGEVVPVFDVASRFGHSPRPVRASQRMIVTAARHRRVALQVDEVEGLVPLSGMEPVPARTDAAVPVAGVAKSSDGLVVIQDLERFLSQAEDVQLADALQRG